jgi:hypothetical protein
MGIMKTVGEIFSPNDPELVEKTLGRLNEQDKWNDVFSTKLIELLDTIDEVKAEIRESLRKADTRLQKAESVSQAEATLLEHAARFGDASQRLEIAHKSEKGAETNYLAAKQSAERAEQLFDKASDQAGLAQRLAQAAKKDLEAANVSLEKIRLQEKRLTRTAIVLVAICWISLAWAPWILPTMKAHLALPIAMTVSIVLIVLILARGRAK